MKRILLLFIIGLLMVTPVWAGDNDQETATKFEGDVNYGGHYYSRYNDKYSHWSDLKLAELDRLDELDDLDAQLDDLDDVLDDLDDELADLDDVHILRRDRSHRYTYKYDHDFDFNFDNKYWREGNGPRFHGGNNLERYDLELDEGDVIITNSGGRHGEIRISEDYELYIDGQHIETNDQQRKVIRKFYISTEELIENAIAVGKWGAKIGVKGAALGFSAIGGIFKLLLPGYDSDDLERDMERKARRIEFEANGIEHEAERLEQLSYELEDLADEMKDIIPELDRLKWF